MFRNLFILGLLAVIIALPFIFRREPPAGAWQPGDPVLVVVTPHNEAIRYEFARAFSLWHDEKYGEPVKIDWRNVGGTTEILRYLQSEYTTAAQAWARRGNKPWPAGGAAALTETRPPAATPAPDSTLSEADLAQQLDLYRSFRAVDDPSELTCKIDLFFGGGQFDHDRAFARGFTVAPLHDGIKASPALLQSVEAIKESLKFIPEKLSGEIWHTPTLFGNALSTFGIVYNVDRLAELGVKNPPTRWDDLADPVYFRQVGVVDPTKSGSIAKAFELLIHQKVHDRVKAFLISSGIAPEAVDTTIAANEKRIGTRWTDPIPDDLKAYQQAIEDGWLDGIRLVQAIGANARYFTDSGSKSPIDVSIGDAAVGMAIDFFGRVQSQKSTAPDGRERMIYVTPVGGTSVSCDPISLLRGAGGNGRTPEEREKIRLVAVRLIEFVLSKEGQKIWNYRVGAPGGPEQYALRRLPIRRDFYPGDDSIKDDEARRAIQAAHERHRPHMTDPIDQPDVNPFALAEQFTYYRRWTGSHFGIQRDLVRAMCMDSGDELRAAWRVIHFGNTANKAERLRTLQRMPTISILNKQTNSIETIELTWRTAPTLAEQTRYEPLEVMREWTRSFRNNYQEAAR